MKLGQLMSYLEVQLPPELRAALSVLQTHSPPMPFEQVSGIVEHELGLRATPLLRHLLREPAAAASIGQVHRAQLPDGTSVAVKVQYPGIEQAVTTDFRSATLGAGFARVFMPDAGIANAIHEARLALLEECDYTREAAYQQRFGDLYRTHATLRVPAIHPAYCSRRILTTTWAEGVGLEEFIGTAPSELDRDRLGIALFEFYVGSLFRHGLYNWDPHPGNYLFTRDGHVVMLDHGSTREFSADLVERLGALTHAVQDDIPGAMHRAFVDVGLVRDDQKYDFPTARSLVRSFYGPTLRDEVVGIQTGDAMPIRSVIAEKRKLLELHMPAVCCSFCAFVLDSCRFWHDWVPGRTGIGWSAIGPALRGPEGTGSKSMREESASRIDRVHVRAWATCPGSADRTFD